MTLSGSDDALDVPRDRDAAIVVSGDVEYGEYRAPLLMQHSIEDSLEIQGKAFGSSQ